MVGKHRNKTINRKGKKDRIWSLLISSSLLLSSCISSPHYSSEPTQETIALVEKYLAEGVELSEVGPVEGYPSPREALLYTLEAIKTLPFMQLEYEGEVRNWILDCRIQQPILIHDFAGRNIGDENHYYDFNYLFYATYPPYGMIGSFSYGYHDETNGWGWQEIIPPGMEDEPSFHFIDEEDARKSLEDYLDYPFENDPVAVMLPFEDLLLSINLYWYFELEGSGSNERSNFLVKSTVPFLEDKEEILSSTTIIQLIPPLSLIDLIEWRSKGMNAGEYSGNSRIPNLVEGISFKVLR